MLHQKIIGFALLAMSLFSLAPVFQKSALNGLPSLSFSNFWPSVVRLLKNRRWMLEQIQKNGNRIFWKGAGPGDRTARRPSLQKKKRLLFP